MTNTTSLAYDGREVGQNTSQKSISVRGALLLRLALRCSDLLALLIARLLILVVLASLA